MSFGTGDSHYHDQIMKTFRSFLNRIQARLFYRLKVQAGEGSLGTPL